jgi:hypothetical protein
MDVRFVMVASSVWNQSTINYMDLPHGPGVEASLAEKILEQIIASDLEIATSQPQTPESIVG